MRRLIVMLQTELDISEREDGFPWLHPGTQARTCTDAGLRPCTDAGLRPCTDTGLRPCTDTGLRPCTDTGLRPCTDTGLRPCTDAGLRPCTDTGLRPCTDAGLRPCTDAGLRPCTDSAHGADQPGDDGRGEQAEQDDRLPDVSHGDVVGICRLLANGLCGGFELLRTVVGGDLAGEQGEADVVPVLFHLGSDLAGGGSVAGLRGADHGGKLRQV